MNKIKVVVESGKKRTFACALEWPGWCRSGRDEKLALEALIGYGPRYAKVLRLAPTGIHREDIKFQAPDAAAEYLVAERIAGNATTDFGAPAVALDSENLPIDQEQYEQFETILRACWRTFDDALQQAAGKELRKGPRGGGKNLEKIIEHVLEADRNYLGRLAWKHKRDRGMDWMDQLDQTRVAVLSALQVARDKGLPDQGPRGGVIWLPRFFVRRVAWHILDHAWEIEDRIT